MKWLDNFIVSPRGQWEYPGKPTAVPTDNGIITMEGVPYPVMGFVPGQPPIIMQPGGKYQFPGKMVYEIPMAYGGDISIPDLSRPNWLDKAQKGQQVHQKIYYNPDEFRIANKAYNDSLDLSVKFPLPPKGYKIYPYEYADTAGFVVGTDSEGNDIIEYRLNKREPIEPIGYTKHLANKSGKNFNKTTGKYEKFFDTERPIYKAPTEEPVYQENPKVELTPNTYMPPSNTAEVLSQIKKEDMYKQKPKVVPAPTFKAGGWLDKYQDGSQVAPNLPWLGTKGQVLTAQEQEEKLLDKKFGVGPTVDKAEVIKAKERIKKTKRIETPLPSGAITPVMGPVEYALMAPVAASTVSAAAPIIGSGLNASIAGIPGLTVGNALGAGFATDAIVNRLPQIPGQLSRGEYADAAVNAATGALDLYGAGMVSPLFKGAKAGKKLPGSPNSGNLVDELREELQREGIVQSQKTLNLPWKNIIRKGIEPWTYEMGPKARDIKSLIINEKNPHYKSPEIVDKEYEIYKKFIGKGDDVNISKEDFIKRYNDAQFLKTRREVVNDRFNKRFAKENPLGFKNRYATWDMYLGKPQTEHPMYDISHLTKSKDDVIYTIKEDFMDKPQIESRLSRVIRDIEQSAKPAAKKKGDNKWIMPDSDSYFGTMGFFHWDIKKLPNGNYEAYANDLWDLQPFKRKGLNNLEIGKALGIGKPLNVKVGFEIDKDTKKILKTYGMAPGAVAGAAAMQKEKYGGWLDNY